MATRWHFGTKHRDYLYSRCRNEAGISGLGNYPICNICNQPVLPSDAWDESHAPEHPKALGGKSVAIAHRTCNRDHGAQVVVPLLAKAEAVRKKYLGITGPGLGKSPMQGGRRSDFSRGVDGRVKPRLTLAQKHAQFLQRRAIIALPVEDFSEPLEVHQ
jgi:hypothetical protein